MLEQNFKFKSIMLVDDNNIDLYITARVLSNSNFAKDIKEYTSAKKALNFLQENQNDFNQLPEIIFVDIYMPQMSGFEFMIEYDKLPVDLKRYCKVYILSSSIDNDDIKRANDDINVVDFQVKTITQQFLDSILVGN